MGKRKPPPPKEPEAPKIPIDRSALDSDLIHVEHNDCAANEITPPTPPDDE